MYCVTCAKQLTTTNEHGLLCVTCYKQNEPAYRNKQHPKLVVVQFCWSCGQRFQPAGAEIRHAQCVY